MKKVLERLYAGELYPSEQVGTQKKGSDYLIDQIVGERERFKIGLDADEIAKLETLEDLYLQASGRYGEESFIQGFRLGAQMMIEVLEQDEPAVL